MRAREPCKYGDGCYRKNEEHRSRFSHPGDLDYPNDAPSSPASRASRFSPSPREEDPAALTPAARASSSGDAAALLDALLEEPVQDLRRSASEPSLEPAKVCVPDKAYKTQPALSHVDEERPVADEHITHPAVVEEIEEHAAEADDLAESAALSKRQLSFRFQDGPAVPEPAGDVVADKLEERVAVEELVERDMANSLEVRPIEIPAPDWVETVRSNKYSLRACCGACCLGLLIFFIVVFASIRVVYEDEQLLIKTTSKRSIRNGPFVDVVWPHMSTEKRKAMRLAELEFASVKDDMTMRMRHQAGPGLVFLGPYEVLVQVLPKTQLQRGEYMRLLNMLTGIERVVTGPLVLMPDPYEEAAIGVEQAFVVNATTTVKVQNKTSGMQRLVTQRGLFVPSAYEVILGLVHARSIEPMKYFRVKDHLTGLVRNVPGPQLFFAGPHDEVVKVGTKMVLEKDEYVRLLSRSQGSERVIRGPAAVVPDAMEEAPDGIQMGTPVSENSAVLVVNKGTGLQRLITVRGVFIPEPYDHILEVRKKIQVLPHQAMLTRDEFGVLHLHISTENAPTSFFLEPHSKIVKLHWSSYSELGVSEPAQKQEIVVIDLRVQRAAFKFEVRTSDSVALRLDGVIFWQIKDVLKTATLTMDAPGDVAQRAKSALLQTVSRLSFKQFMTNFRAVSAETAAIQNSDSFLTDRGLELHSIDVTNYACVDPETQLILQSMIAEVTFGLNRLQEARSEAEVKKTEILGLIELEKQRTILIQAKAENTRLEAAANGRAKGEELSSSAQSFLENLNATDVELAGRLDLYKRQELGQYQNQMTGAIGTSRARSYMSASDLRLDLKSEL
eukprot:TRINITY_DN15014_c0_g1_i2.p1 TRINITY_DN15014_c0_g1~~TRINITY_DN15014_c0_g1_i2.p1  ORF type:complete len:859 (-),score=123.64 TRINITY_DN15014_c0_g1_i2:189-2714(-)